MIKQHILEHSVKSKRKTEYDKGSNLQQIDLYHKYSLFQRKNMVDLKAIMVLKSLLPVLLRNDRNRMIGVAILDQCLLSYNRVKIITVISEDSWDFSVSK